MDDRSFLDEPVEDVLTGGPIHKVMLFFCRAEMKPGWQAIVTAVLLSALLGLFWWLLSQAVKVGWLIGLGQVLFMGLDMAVLIMLPKKEVSFGPWKAQLFALAVPRWGVTVALALFLLWFDRDWLLFAVFVGQVGITAAYLWGLLIEPHRLRLSHLTIEIDKWASDVPPLRLLHITDLHVERLTKREAKLLHLVKEAAPDLIVITGDYVNLSYNRDPETYTQVRQLLSQLWAPYGIYATLGSPPVDLREEVIPLFAGLDIQLLRWDTAVLPASPHLELTILGMDCTHHLPTDRQRLDTLVHKASHHVPRILLYHSPELMPEAVQHGLDLYLCGHTHGGQVRLPLIGPLLTSSQLGRRYVMGHYHEEGTHLYVSRGIGLEGLSAPRVRFMAPPEITLVTLQGKKAI